MLIEALIAILIFSVGILGIVGLQATAVKQSTDARYRAEAAQLVEQLVGQMWTSNRATATLQTQYNTGGAGYNAWYDQVAAVLPGVSNTSDSDTKPMVNVDGDGIVTVNVFWRQPGDDANASPHRYDIQTQIAP
jgi:type IV pilus assembly protein PilV